VKLRFDDDWAELWADDDERCAMRDQYDRSDGNMRDRA
jgi:hypothetical protein